MAKRHLMTGCSLSLCVNACRTENNKKKKLITRNHLPVVPLAKRKKKEETVGNHFFSLSFSLTYTVISPSPMDEWYTHNHVISLCLFLIAYMQVCLPVSVSRHKHVGREKMIATGGCA